MKWHYEFSGFQVLRKFGLKRPVSAANIIVRSCPVVLHCIEEFRWIGDFCLGGRKMSHKDETKDGDLLVALAMFHGIYKRVARKLGVGGTMVSRVARGKRNSPEISEAIHSELRSIRDYLNRAATKLNGG
jgi:hypothetical protein